MNTNTHTHTHTHEHTHSHICTYIHMYMYVYTCSYIHVHLISILLSKHVHNRRDSVLRGFAMGPHTQTLQTGVRPHVGPASSQRRGLRGRGPDLYDAGCFRRTEHGLCCTRLPGVRATVRTQNCTAGLQAATYIPSWTPSTSRGTQRFSEVGAIATLCRTKNCLAKFSVRRDPLASGQPHS